MANTLPPAPPPEALSDGESNKFLSKYKASLCKRWSMTKMDSLYEIADLATFLWALERPKEAIAIAESVAVNIPAPPPLSKSGFNYNIWCPATNSHAVVSHLSGGLAKTSKAAILADPGISRDNPNFLGRQVAEALDLEAAAPNPKEIKWECKGLAKGVRNMLMFVELASDATFAPYAPEASELLPRLLLKLGAKLRTA